MKNKYWCFSEKSETMMAKDLLRVFILCCVFFSFFVTFTESKSFILTSPRVIDAGSTVYFTLTVFDVPWKERITLRLTHQKSNVLIAESEVHVQPNFSMWVEMTVPPMPSDVPAKLHVIGSFSEYQIEKSENVYIRHNTILTFVQTDKPLYKPGQTIRFRVLPMDNQLRPLAPNTVGDIWIEDPTGIRVAQWKDVQFTEGIKQFELPLSDEPPLGTWNIHTLINEVAATQTFIVKKYVLPKFDVVLKPPSIVMADALTIPIEICAKYTYGKHVDGNLKAKVTYKKLRWTHKYRDQSNFIPSVEHQSQISGCHVFEVNTDDLLMQTEEFGGNELEVFAEVTENATGIVRNATTFFKISHEKVLLKFIRDNDYYKPNMPYVGFVEAKLPDGTPAVSEKIQICVVFQSKKCLIFTSDKNGLIQFTIKPIAWSRVIRVEATTINYENVHYSSTIWTRKLRKPFASITLRKWFSLSGSYIQIEPTTDEFQCDKAQKVKVQYTGERGTTEKFYHQVLSKGRIVQQGSHQRTFYSNIKEIQYDFEEEMEVSSNNSTEREIGEFILTFDARATMSPKSRLLIFYIRDDKEVVADSRIFRIKKCLQNKVSLDFRHPQQYPNTEATMLLSASPSSLCGISMVDKSVRLLEDDTTFNKEKLFKIMESYDTGRDIPKDPPGYINICKKDVVEHMTYIDSHMPHFRRLVDAQLAFEAAGMIVITDLKINSHPVCIKYKIDYDDDEPIPIMRSLSRAHFELPGEVQPDAPPQLTTKPEAPSSVEEIRSYFPETWLWELHSVDSTGEIAIKRKLPHTITEWVGGSICVHPKTGLGISDTGSITTFQPFFIDFQLPYSVVRGESLSLVVTVFNYLSECLPIKLSLEPSEDYMLLSELRYQKVCTCGGKSASVRFPISLVTLGKVNITVYGYSIEQDDEICGNEVTARLSARDAVTKELLVEAEGFPKEDTFNYFICPENTNGSFATEIPLLLPDDVIVDSARAYMTITGDVMGPAIKGLKKLVRLPVGCGEQNMVLFAPNIFVMDYLDSTGKITDDIKEECINNMRTGYQRELQYRHSDGSYSAFGPRDEEGSLWLTAFVLRSFGQARRFISVDDKDINMSKTWILKMQFENGCFIPSGTVFHKEMKGGLKSGEQSLAPLSAYVLISLLESDAEMLHDTLVVRNALKCLETEIHPDVYVLSLFAYASALAKETAAATKYVKELDKRAITKDYLKYWEPSSNSKSVAVEIAGYYMLARFEIEESVALENVLPVVRWITQQRNSEGGFVSTQDTVVALQALAKYASYHSNKTLDIALAVETDDMSHGFKLDESNKLVTQQLKITDLPTTIDIDAYGDGCAIVQFSSRYNVEKISNLGELELNVNARRRGSNECNLPSLGICMRYSVYKEKTNMAVLSVKMPSGFVADEWSLLLLENDEEVQLMRHDITENEVNLYFEEITNDAKCFEFHIKSEFEVKDIKPSLIRLYDYYQPERQVTKEYSIPSTCNTTSLPDLPWLPLFNPLVEKDIPETSEFPDIANADYSETEFPLKTMEPLTDGETENISSPNLIEELPDQFIDDNLIRLENLNTTNNAEQNVIKNVSHLSTFTDVDHDLDFPDGLEGNMPVSILPPVFEERNCPICSDSFPENFTSIYCNSAFALKVIKRESNVRTVKIVQDVSFYIDSPKAVKKFGELEYEEDCVCSQLTEKGKVLFVVGSPLNLWNSSGRKHRIHLRSSVYIILVPQKQIHTFITEAKISCADDP